MPPFPNMEATDLAMFVSGALAGLLVGWIARGRTQ
jgi:hypothetical protein